MTDQGGGRRQPPTDDRTLLDPLNADELKALREARQKMQAAKGSGGHQVVIGPDAGEDIGDAPTRAMPALPQFENPGVTLEKIPTGSMPAVTRPTPGQGTPRPTPAPSQPMSAAPTQPAGAPGPQGPVAGPTGFGENTLMWMSPPKPPVAPTTANTGGMTGEMKAVSAGGTKRTLLAVGAFVVIGGLIASFAFLGGKKERAVIDLHTNPGKASVKINGKATSNLTPMKLNLPDGDYEIEVALEGYKTETFTIKVEKGAAPSRRDIELEPLSREGMMTVAVAVQPVNANITIDTVQYPGKRNVSVPNLDPNQPHKIIIEAGGYLKVEQEIPAGQLKKSYHFILQQDESQKLGGGGAPGGAPAGGENKPQ